MDFPDVPIVMAHMGFVDVIFADAAIKMARRAPNLYLDTTGVSADTKVTAAARAIGASRILCGSDSPFTNPALRLLELNAQNFLTKKKNSFWGKMLKGSWIHWVGNEKETRERNPLRGSQWYQDSHHQRNRLGGGKIIAKIEGGKGVKSTLDSWPPKKNRSLIFTAALFPVVERVEIVPLYFGKNFRMKNISQPL